LTGTVVEMENPEALPTTAPRVESRLSEDWIQHDVVLRIWARQNAASSEWETLIPEYSIAGMGDSFDAAIENVLELLEDYLWLCQREGKSFEQCARPMPIREMARLVGEYAVGRLIGELGRGGAGRRRLDVPLSLAAH
jgi:hypothetical protein